ADQEQRVGLMATEKFQQRQCLASRRSQVKVRNPYRAIVFDGGREQWRAVSGPFRRVRPLMIEYPIHRDAAPSISPSAAPLDHGSHFDQSTEPHHKRRNYLNY